MDKKLINYILIVVIVLILSYFFKNMLVKGLHVLEMLL